MVKTVCTLVLSLIIILLTHIAMANEQQKSAQQRTYTVQKGETLSHVADKFNIHHKKIMEANNMKSVNVWEGMKLKIPEVNQAQVQSASHEKEVAKNSPAVNKNEKDGVKDLRSGESAESSIKKVNTQANKTTVNKSDLHPASVTYTVQKGETLSHVADKFNIHHKKIMEANNMKSVNVWEGMKLKIPDVAASALPDPQMPQPDSGQAQVKKPAETISNAVDTKKVDKPQGATNYDLSNSGTYDNKLRYPVSSREYSNKEHGIQFKAGEDNIVRAAKDGAVIYVGDGIDSLKQLVIIKHGKNLSTLYGNLVEVKVKQGDKLKSGDVIGGYAAQNGMFFAVRDGGSFQNPVQYLSK